MKLIKIYLSILLIMPFFIKALCDDRMTRPIIADTFCTLTQCCAETEQHFVDTFTALQELNNSVTACCNDILIILDGVGASCTVDLSETLTALDLFFNTLTTCCASFESTLTEILNSLVDKGCVCLATPITSAGTITDPGVYCLENDIAGQITIASDNVVLDLNDHEISSGTNGIVINAATQNVVVRNGRIRSTTGDGIVINNGCQNIELGQLNLILIGGTAINVQGTVGSPVQDCVLASITTEGCDAGIAVTDAINITINAGQFFDTTGTVAVINVNTVNNCHITDCLIRRCNSRAIVVADTNLVLEKSMIANCVGALSLENSPGTVVQDIIIQESTQLATASFLTSAVITATTSDNSIFDGIMMENITIGDGVRGVVFDHCSEMVLKNSLFNNIESSNTAVGIESVIGMQDSPNCSIDHCTITNFLQTQPLGIGQILYIISFIDSPNAVIKDTKINNISAATLTASQEIIHLENFTVVTGAPAGIINNCDIQQINNFNTIIANAGTLTPELEIRDTTLSNIVNVRNCISLASENNVVDNVVINNIQGTTSALIGIRGLAGSIIKNAVIENLQAASVLGDVVAISVFGGNAGQAIIDNCTMLNIVNTGGGNAFGINVDSPLAVIIKNCVVALVQTGYALFATNNSVIDNCIANNCSFGFILDPASVTCAIGNSFAYNCVTRGFSNSGANSRIYNNYAAKNGTNYFGGTAPAANTALGGVFTVGVNISG